MPAAVATLNGGTPQFTGFTGNVTVDGGILTVGHSEALGGRQGQVVTLKPGSAIINNTGFGLGLNGLPNNIAFGSGPIYLNGGTLLFNIANATTGIALGGLGNNIEVNANSQITLDNGALAGTDNDLAFGSLKINGPYTLRLFSFDSMDASFTGTHVFTGVPTIDMTQATSGGNGTGFFTLNVAITGSWLFHWRIQCGE
ncbi:MAG TPA: hypothetical protein VFD27_12035 [Chthoniobacteraceae bacterium]|nr:hypothetical protein [Chthoniobacteraceae bacterium]